MIAAMRRLRASCGGISHVLGRSLSGAVQECTFPRRIDTRGVPIYLFADPEEVEGDALAQLRALASSPFPVGFVVALPDVHVGKGTTVGTVFATEKAVAPYAVGVDIGCGMCSVPLKGLVRSQLTRSMLVRIQSAVKKAIPTGFDCHKHAVAGASRTVQNISSAHPPSAWLQHQITKESRSRVETQLGTLGGGNHFLEVLYEAPIPWSPAGVSGNKSGPEHEHVWLMLHSGSRYIGNGIAQHHHAKARELHGGKKGRDSSGGGSKAGELYFLDVDSSEGQDYLADMAWAQAYALENRRIMMELLATAVHGITGVEAEWPRLINTHHNYCQCESCQFRDPSSGKLVQRKLWVTRKGATSARLGEWGIIPGSMGTGSFIVYGRGSPMSWMSCSHGAGRRMSRTQALSRIPQEEFVRSLGDVVCDRSPKLRDEAPAAYKDLSDVLLKQKELIEVRHRLLPLVNVKGY